MFIINLGGSHVPDVSAITDSIPPPSAAERAQFDVAKETEVLYGVYLELTRKSQSEGIPEAASLGRLFAKTTWRWWTMTGGWENVDKRISGKYDPLFIVFVGAAHSMLSGMKAVALERKKRTQKMTCHSGSIFGPSHQPRDNQRPFDKVGATRALFQVAQHINSSPDSESAVAKALFEHLAGVWWYETGGPARIHKDVLASFPGWFVGKLSTSRPQQNASRLAPKDSLQFDVDKETRSLFEMAKKRLPRAPLGMEVVFYDFGLDRESTFSILRWFDNTGGWKNVDKAIRDQYPKWFVDYIANIAKLAPAAKKLASQF